MKYNVILKEITIFLSEFFKSLFFKINPFSITFSIIAGLFTRLIFKMNIEDTIEESLATPAKWRIDNRYPKRNPFWKQFAAASLHFNNKKLLHLSKWICLIRKQKIKKTPLNIL